LATTLPELPGRIEDAVATVTLELLNDVWTEIEYEIWCLPDDSRCPHCTSVKCRSQNLII
jgi:hypothetical protein